VPCRASRSIVGGRIQEKPKKNIFRFSFHSSPQPFLISENWYFKTRDHLEKKMTNTIWGHSHTHKLGPILKALNHRTTEREANNTHCLRLSSMEKRIFLLSKRRGYLWGAGEEALFEQRHSRGIRAPPFGGEGRKSRFPFLFQNPLFLSRVSLLFVFFSARDSIASSIFPRETAAAIFRHFDISLLGVTTLPFLRVWRKQRNLRSKMRGKAQENNERLILYTPSSLIILKMNERPRVKDIVLCK